jgi:hypothetical protein
MSQVSLFVTSAAGVNGDGYGALLAFDCDGRAVVRKKPIRAA